MRRAVFAAGLLCLAACQPQHAEWQDVCVSSHTDMTMVALPVSDGKGGMSIQMSPIYDTVCDAYQRKCVPGRDGSKICN